MGAEMAGVDVRHIVADRTPADGSFDFENRLRQLIGIGAIHLQDKESQPLRGFRTDTGKLLELLDQPIDGLRDIGH